MDSHLFPDVIRTLPSDPSRRGLLAALGGGLLTYLPLALDAEAKKKKKHKKKKSKPKIRVDATCQGSGSGFFGSGGGRLAQTFAPERSGKLVRVQTLIKKDEGTSGDYVMHVATVNDLGVPTNNLLASTAIPNEDVITGTSLVTFNFADPATVQTGKDYALIWTRSGSGDVLSVGANSSDTCPGSAFTSPSLIASFNSAFPVYDLVFTAFVRS